MDTITDANFVSRFISERLMARGILRSPSTLRRYRQGAEDPDSKLVFLNEGRQRFVVTVSPALFPEVIAEECLKAAQMRSLLGDLGGPILEPLDTGRIQGSSYAVLPYRRPLSKRRGLSWIDRLSVKRPLLEWLLQVAERRSGPCEVSTYEASVRALSRFAGTGSATGALLRTAERHLSSGGFSPRSSPMHGDLWQGNVLHGAGSLAFTLVDWRGSATNGFPIFDLLRAAESFRLSPAALHRELHFHRLALKCRLEDLAVYLIGALGHYASHIGEMPPALFRSMSEDCVRRLSCALDAAPLSGAGRRLGKRSALDAVPQEDASVGGKRGQRPSS